MKTKTKNLVFLLVIGFVFPLIINLNFNFNQNNKHNFNKPKTSAIYTDILINGSATGPGAHNWTWAITQPWCTGGNGTQENPYIIEDSIFLPSGSSDCLTITNSRQYFVVENCTFKDTPINGFTGLRLNNVTNAYIIDNQVYNNSHGIHCLNVNNSQLIDNNSSNNKFNGIFLDDCYYNTISGNTANDNNDGIYISTSCDNNFIEGNTANGNDYGIYLDNECDNNTISGNTANDNNDGIYLDNECNNNTISGNTANNNNYEGITIYDTCHFNKITGNTANGNDYGIYLDYECENNTITENVLYNNTFGILIDSSTSGNNSIYKNFFLENEKHAEDWGTDNKWNSTTIGNYWDNHTTPDANDDGIVDDPYTYISGDAGSTDYLPIAEDGAPRITINSPDSGDNFGIDAPSFEVIITDVYVYTRWYTINGGLHNYTFTENGMINQSAWDALADGATTLKFYASDIVGNIGSAEVSIIKDTIAPIIIINSPAEGERFGKNAPLFNITVTEDNLDIMWYSFDGGAHIYFITNNTVFNQTAWTKLAQGDVTITFYARDIAGNEASESVTVIKSVPSGLDPGMIITIVIVSVVGGVAIISVVYIFMKKRTTP